MRRGVYDVLPTYALDSLSPETMRLLLCGCQQVDLDMLKRITMFSDESSEFVVHTCVCVYTCIFMLFLKPHIHVHVYIIII